MILIPGFCKRALLDDDSPGLFAMLDLSTARVVVPWLAEWLENENWEVRKAAANALGALREHAKDKVPDLIELLSDDDPRVRTVAVEVLGTFGEHAKDKVPDLVELLSDGESRVRRAAANALGAIGEHAKDSVPDLIELLSDDDLKVRAAAADVLRTLGKYAEGQASRLGELLNDEREDIRRTAAEVLGMLGKYAEDQAPVLVKQLNLNFEQLDSTLKQQSFTDRQAIDRSSDVRIAIAEALRAFEMHAKSQASLVVERLSDERGHVRRAAAEVLGALGEHAKDMVPDLIALLSDDDSRVHAAAADALVALGEHAKDHVLLLVKLLDDDDPRVRTVAVEVLGALGAHAKDQAPLLIARLTDNNSRVRAVAAQVLGALGEHAKDMVPDLIALLSDDDSRVHAAAADALVALGEHAKDHVLLLVKLLDEDDPRVRTVAVEVLGALGAHAKDQAPLLIARLTDNNSRVRAVAAQVLGALGEHAKDMVPDLIALLSDDDSRVHAAAADALVALGEHAKDHVLLLVKLLDEDDPDVQQAAADALGGLGEHAKDHAHSLAKQLNDDHPDVQQAAKQALRTLGPFDIKLTPAIIVHRYGSRTRTGELRFLAHLLGGGDGLVEDLLRWLPEARDEPLQMAKIDHQWARKSLSVFNAVWPHTEPEPYEDVRDDIGRRTARLVSEVGWTSNDLGLLEVSESNLSAADSPFAAVIEQKILKIKSTRWGLYGLVTIIGHMVFWTALIFAYPRYTPVQAIFFWDKWVRRIIGFGYVGFLLAWVPFLRQRLLAPFKDSLVADAKLAEFHDEDYFKESLVKLPDGEVCPVTKALSQISGQVILEGESGIGKSMFLRHLVKSHHKLVIFLRASDCKKGVLESILEKFEGPAKDSDFLSKLIFAGAIDVVIDGLNGVSADTRAGIVNFAKRFFAGNLLLAIQPMEWDPPPLAKVYKMLSLTDAQIKAFLVSRFVTLPVNTEITADAYAKLCREYLTASLSKQSPRTTSAAAREVLSNPMDLTVVAQLLVQKRDPNLFELQQQYFQLVEDDFKSHNNGKLFPRETFAKRVYQMRLEGRSCVHRR